MLEAQGSVLTNKYAEGYPGRRYYGGCEWVDVAERLARTRATALFGAEHANVQPHSGSTANMAAYMTLAQPGDTVLGLRLDHGGHLTHGNLLNFSGQLYRFVSYGVRREDELIDYDELAALAQEHRPAADRGRRQRLLPDPGLRGFRAIADSRGCQAAGGHGPHRRPGGRRRPPQPGPARRTSSPPPPTRPCAAPAPA